jgi:hypothetical protein
MLSATPDPSESPATSGVAAVQTPAAGKRSGRRGPPPKAKEDRHFVTALALDVGSRMPMAAQA